MRHAVREQTQLPQEEDGMSGNTQTRHYRIFTRSLGNHDVTAQTKREAIARVVARLGLEEERCATVNTWAVAEVRK